MKYFQKNPGARRAYRARWADYWAKMLATGGVSPDEEEATRRDLLRQNAGVSSSNDLSARGYAAVMLHMGAYLGQAERGLRSEYRARRIYKIEHLAADLRPADPDSYIHGTLDSMGILRDPARWRTGLSDADLQKLMITLEAQQRRNKKRAVEKKE